MNTFQKFKQSLPKKKKYTYFCVSDDDEKADTVKDKFWRDLDQGKFSVKPGDLYSTVKSEGRRAKPSCLAEDNVELFASYEEGNNSYRRGGGGDNICKENKRLIRSSSSDEEIMTSKTKNKKKKFRTLDKSETNEDVVASHC